MSGLNVDVVFAVLIAGVMVYGHYSAKRRRTNRRARDTEPYFDGRSSIDLWRREQSQRRERA